MQRLRDSRYGGGYRAGPNRMSNFQMSPDGQTNYDNQDVMVSASDSARRLNDIWFSKSECNWETLNMDKNLRDWEEER